MSDNRNIYDRVTVFLFVLFLCALCVPVLWSSGKGNKNYDNDHAKASQSKAESRPSRTSIAKPVDPVRPQIKSKENESAANQVSGSEIQDDSGNISFSVFLAVAVAAATVFNAFFAGYQLRILNRQNAVMIAQNELAQASLHQNESLLELLQLEQRPWVSLNDVKLVQYEANKQVIVAVQLTNRGNSPAIIKCMLGSWVVCADEDSPQMLRDLETLKKNTHEGEVLAIREDYLSPNDELTMNFRMPAITQDAIDSLARTAATLFILGCIRYEDVFNTRHCTTWCCFYHAGEHAIAKAGKHNYMD